MAGHNAVNPGFEAGQASVGVQVDLEPLAPVGPGRSLVVEATILTFDYRRAHLAILGHDGDRPFVRGTHDRVVVDLARFLERWQRTS